MHVEEVGVTQRHKISLATVTLCCIDCTARLPWAIRAMDQCMQGVSFGDVILCTDRTSLTSQAIPRGIRAVEIDPIRSIEGYSEFMLKKLAPIIQTDHVLIVQWDGYVLNPMAWREEFLAYDYLGAPWQHYSEPWSVGNGGFSLRSSKLLRALEDPAIIASHPEDSCICQTYRAELEQKGIRFAPREVARYFAVEDGPLLPDVFGFHSPCHLPAVLSLEDADAFIASLGPSVLRAHYFGSLLRELTAGVSKRPELAPLLHQFQQLILSSIDGMSDADCMTAESLGVCKALIRYGEHAAAARLLKRRRQVIGRPWAELRLWWRLKVSSLFQYLAKPK